ncbi:hypothetical protein HYW29_00970 [Candidatus Amesbacteria bacterium]|nr:hypothetical protein [Candidatus Amesbacteria bacterium]
MPKKEDNWWSMAGVVALALVLPVLLRGVNYLQRVTAGAEGRLAAINVDVERPIGPLPQPWRALAQGGDQIKTFMDGNTERIRELGVQYIRIDHVYDGFNTVKMENGTMKLDWTDLDILVDKITTAGATPFFSLSYMPANMASGDEVSEPTDWKLWADLVQKTIEHYSGEKGLTGVYYEVWNEPDLFGKWTMGGKKDYKKLYAYAAAGARGTTGVNPFKLGGPATTELYRNWIDKFFPFILENNLRLDFFSWHRYDPDTNKYAQDVMNVDRWLDSHPYFANVEKIISEMGPQSEAGGINDTDQGAVYLIAGQRELLYKANFGFSFAVAGKYGILGKPREEALKMLGKLGRQRLSISGEGTWVRAIGAMKDGTYQILVANYDSKGMHSEVVPVSFMNLKNNNFVLKQTFLSGKTTQEDVATTAAVWQKQIAMTPNSAVLLELTSVIKPQ